MFIPRGVELVRLVDTPGGNIIHVVYSIYSVYLGDGELLEAV